MKIISISLLLFIIVGNVQTQAFVHPGIDMNQQDLEYMKKQVLAGREPWSNAFKNLKEKALKDIEAEIVPVTHVIRGPYGRPDVGASALWNNSATLYDLAVLWFITNEELYARKALEIIEKWSGRVWSFDDNDAKLLGGLSCHPFCAGAEILRYNYKGWTPAHTEQFSRMLMESYYPLLRFYFPEANGNWDGVIAKAVMAMAVFTDNRPLFDEAVNHFLHAPANGSLFKYIFPSGQCQETTRDIAHIQMGLLEFGGAARIAYTQGIDLLSLGNNRLALGIEYALDIIFGGNPQSYGVFSTRGLSNRRNDYEYFYRHYQAKGVKTPLLEKVSDEVRSKIGRDVLNAFRAEFQDKQSVPPTIDVRPGTIAYPAGATNQPVLLPVNRIDVQPGEDLQAALDQSAGTGRCVVAKTGIHKLTKTLQIPSGTYLAGEGLGSVLMFESVNYYAVAAKDTSMHDVRISNLIIEGASSHEIPSDPNTGRFNRSGRFTNALTGIAFLGLSEGSMKNIVLDHVTVIHFSRNGVMITGADNVEINNCNISDNGAGIVPGPRLQHNLLLRHVSNVRIRESRFDTSIAGCGITLDNCLQVTIERCEIARNAWMGLLMSTSDHITVAGNLIEGNTFNGIMSEFQYFGCNNLDIKDNIIQYNGGFGIETYGAKQVVLSGNKYDLNGTSAQQEHISAEQKVILK